jgi:hypothetical protein
VQVIDTVRTDSTEPPYAAYSTRYSGMVVADLKGPDSQQLRCRFHLNVPAAGMHGGGQGNVSSPVAARSTRCSRS